jgi:hypothetical protein
MKIFSDHAIQAADLDTVKAQALLAVETLEAKHKSEIDALRTQLRLHGILYAVIALGIVTVFYFR